MQHRMNPMRHLPAFLVICTLAFASIGCGAATSADPSSPPPPKLEFPTTAPATPDRQADFHVDPKQVITYLASDELQGRLIGTPQIQRAADLIAADFSKLGLKTVPGLDGYFQPFEMTTSIEPDAQTTMLEADGRTYHPGDEMIPLRMSAEKSAHGPLAFAGYGEELSTAHYDDFAGIDLKGKIAMILRFEPSDPATGKSRFADATHEYSEHAALQTKIAAAANHGAVGVIFVNPPLRKPSDGLIPFSRMAMYNAPVPVVQVTPNVADALLKAAGSENLESLQKQIDQSGKPDSKEMGTVTAKLAVAFHRTQKSVENVVGVLPGEGPHADEYVVVCAHYDHLGHGGPYSLAPWSHAIHHGADDNASGTACMMEIADRFAHQPAPARSMLFIAFTGEEEGLIGSAHFVNNPPISIDKIVADLNLDMVGRVEDDKLLIGGEGTAADFPQIVQQADRGLPLKLGEFGKGGLGPSDHMSFAMKKIPVLFFYDKMLIDYHRPTDTADKINFKGLDEVATLGQHVAEAMTTMPRQTYDDKYDAQGLTLMGVSHGSSAALGVVPDYSQGDDSHGGVRISGTVPGSAAEKSGLKEGDVITQFDKTKIDNLIDLSNALAEAKPGQKVKLQVKRGGKMIEIEATLTERK